MNLQKSEDGEALSMPQDKVNIEVGASCADVCCMGLHHPSPKVLIGVAQVADDPG